MRAYVLGKAMSVNFGLNERQLFFSVSISTDHLLLSPVLLSILRSWNKIRINSHESLFPSFCANLGLVKSIFSLHDQVVFFLPVMHVTSMIKIMTIIIIIYFP